MKNCNFILKEPFHQLVRRFQNFGARTIDCRSQPYRREDIAMKVVIRKTGQQAKAIRSSKLKRFSLPWEEMSNWAMPAQNTFRLTRGTRSESDVSGIMRINQNASPTFRKWTEGMSDFMLHSGKPDSTGNPKVIKKPRKLL